MTVSPFLADFRAQVGTGRPSYVTTVHRARILGGEGRSDGVEVDGLDWFERPQLPDFPLGSFATTLLTDLENL